MPEIIAWVVSFLVVTVAVSGLAGRVGWSAPVALVAVGAALSFVPGVPQIVIEPDAVLYGLLPPLLFAAARWRAARSAIRSRVSPTTAPVRPVAAVDGAPRPGDPACVAFVGSADDVRLAGTRSLAVDLVPLSPRP
ncbi:hypothetical protein [Clavibacter nebraskensis]|uniref:hypothetical protein n=1 Tax=Clavibacter nebraskensis TaxID=31963 RepID=UPI000348728D|nr:hypothetical protein [Clavibacter nebraskensis]KXU20921.1 hypothetical protein VV38_05595 [Clavibacter nebraskensis]OAH22366.1 hypothetical protein A3Q38_02970 [Clavibacter nebraskensis]